jgi:hypothetical protein
MKTNQSPQPAQPVARPEAETEKAFLEVLTRIASTLESIAVSLRELSSMYVGEKMFGTYEENQLKRR